MKKTILILSLILLIGCKSKKGDSRVSDESKETSVVKLALTDVDNNQKAKAYELGNRILMTCNTSKFKPFTESEATETVINNITLDKLSKTCTRYRQYYGDFKDIELVEIYKENKEPIIIYRYKALYTKKVANKELRVYMNNENKVSAIKTMDWADEFKNK